MKRLRNFLTSFLISVVVFCLPVYADFTSTDSFNLSSIQIYARSIDNGVSNVISSISNISTYFINLISSVGDLSDSLATYFNSYRSWYLDISSSLDDIISLLSFSEYPSKFLGYDALIYFDHNYFSSLYSSSGSVVFDDQTGYITLSGVSSFSIYNHNDQDSLFLSPGSYYVLCSSPQELSSFYLSSNGYSGSVSDYYSISLDSVSHRYSMYSHVYVLVVYKSFLVDEIVVSSSSSMSGIFYGGVVPWSDNDYADASMNPDQDSTVSDVDDAGQQQSQQEEEMWQNINTYKGDISFNLDGWDDAAGGLSYVTGVFMTIWNNSPTQPIVLSLMLGIAMLSIGRGVMAAVRVSRNRGDD